MPNNHNKWIILDRDGVINHDSLDYIKNVDEWIPIENSIRAISLLYKNNFKIIIITNQSGLSKKLFTIEDLKLMHDKLTMLIEKAGAKIEKIYFCPHNAEHNCICRKPKNGLFEKAKLEFNISCENRLVFSIGDSLRDLIASKKSNLTPVLVKTGKGENTLKEIKSNPEHMQYFSDLLIFDDLFSATENIINKQYSK